MTRPDPRETLLDMDPEAFRAAAHAVVDRMADYLQTVETRPVFPAIEPGSLRPQFPAAAPEAPANVTPSSYSSVSPPSRRSTSAGTT